MTSQFLAEESSSVDMPAQDRKHTFAAHSTRFSRIWYRNVLSLSFVQPLANMKMAAMKEMMLPRMIRYDTAKADILPKTNCTQV